MSLPPRILLFTGDGKGKTTAALGIALRAAGRDLRVAVVQFLKADASVGECEGFRLLAAAGAKVEFHQTGLGFLPKEGSPRFDAHREAAQSGLNLASRLVDQHACDVLILDEVCGAVARRALDEDAVCDLLARLPDDRVCVLTGREASARLVAMADTVTEMRVVKHAYDSGRAAQKGVEC